MNSRIPLLTGHPHWCEKLGDCDTANDNLDLHHIGFRSRMYVENGGTRYNVDIHRYDIVRASWADVTSVGVQIEMEDLEAENGVLRSWMTPDDARSLAHMLLSQADLAEREALFASNTSGGES